MVGVETHVWLTQPSAPATPWLRRAAAAEQNANVLMDDLAARHPEMAAHLERAGELASQVALRMGLENESLWKVGYAARLHDIGKLEVPKGIIDKPGPLTEEEWEVMRRHTIAGARILEEIPCLAPVAPLVRSSHERWDGTGYPDGLAGEQIPLESRIVFVCDAFDAITSARPYQGAVSVPKALAELASCSGTQFDRRVIGALGQLTFEVAAA
jgi:HD-GYP domain-containing protein (c-di-GMP phosphodiesterase class II)